MAPECGLAVSYLPALLQCSDSGGRGGGDERGSQFSGEPKVSPYSAACRRQLGPFGVGHRRGPETGAVIPKIGAPGRTRAYGLDHVLAREACLGHNLTNQHIPAYTMARSTRTSQLSG